MDYKKMAAAFAAGGAVLAAGAAYTMKQKNNKQPGIHFSTGGGRHVYLSDTSLASLAVAVYLIRDYNFDGDNIHIFAPQDFLGGRCSKANNKEVVLNGNVWLHENDCCRFWELFRSIPSVENKGASVKGDIVHFNQDHPFTLTKLPILRSQNEGSLGVGKKERRFLEKLVLIADEKLEKVSVQDWFGENSQFFQSDFWILLRTLYELKESSSVRFLRTLLLTQTEELRHIKTLEGWMQLPQHPYDALIVPLYSYLKGYGVHFHIGASITDIRFSDTYNLRANHLLVQEGKQRYQIEVNSDDLCICALGEEERRAAFGSMDASCQIPAESEDLWNCLASHRSELNVPGKLFEPKDGAQGTFIIKLKETDFIALLQQANIDNRFWCLADSNWGLSFYMNPQSETKDEIADISLYGSVLYPFELGDYVRKPFAECAGKEILIELLSHLGLQEHLEEIVKQCNAAIPCVLPHAQAAKLAENEPVLNSAKLNDSNFAVLSPYRKIASCNWLENQVAQAYDTVENLMHPQIERKEQIAKNLKQQAKAIRLLRQVE